jgi:DNA polymerase II small subunit/DNA polymerase delta subunit B
MNEKDIVRRFFEEGMLLSPRLLPKINEGNIDDMILKSRNRGAVADDAFVKGDELSVEIRKPQRKTRLSPKDFTEYYNNKFNSIKDMLSGRVQAISISNAKNSYSEVSVIGMVKEISPGGFLLEDVTGEIGVSSRKTKEVSEDDVIGVNGFVKEGRLFENDIIFPDIPLNREMTRINGISVLLTERMDEKIMGMKKDFGFVITTDDAQDKKTKTVKSTPAWITLKADGKSVSILAYNPGKNTGSEEITQCLRKRHLGPQRSQIRGPLDDFVIDRVPDIFWVISSEKWAKIYKGVVIISTGNEAAGINLGTMEYEFINPGS